MLRYGTIKSYWRAATLRLRPLASAWAIFLLVFTTQNGWSMRAGEERIAMRCIQRCQGFRELGLLVISLASRADGLHLRARRISDAPQFPAAPLRPSCAPDKEMLADAQNPPPENADVVNSQE
jgi:hypothetical protein